MLKEPNGLCLPVNPEPKEAFGGDPSINIGLAVSSVVLIFLIPWLAVRAAPKLAGFLPATLITIVVLTIAANVVRLDVEHVSLATTFASFGDVVELVRQQIPTEWTVRVIALGLPFAFRLTMLCYLDTLLTSLVVDKLSGEKTQQDRELAAQGVANGLVALIGGIPGAQATIRSVLIIKEKATLRLAGALVGFFVIVEMLMFQNLISHIPQALFAGILFKVGYDVFDWTPLRLYTRELLSRRFRFEDLFGERPEEAIFVTHWEMLFVAGTAAVTVLWDLTVAVIAFAALFYLVRRFRPMRDLTPITETRAVTTED